uniref:Uncharacterized protein n=1 Tax=Amphimedon queenslandica TaxID=400682 RepID=A0A1X7V4T4_AMPQE
MASQANERTHKAAVTDLSSFIRGYCASMEVWTPFIVELLLRRDPDNIKDGLAVWVLKDRDIVTSLLIFQMLSHFLQWECNKGFVTVTGKKVNRGTGSGLEIPGTYQFYGPEPYTLKS